MRRGLSLGLLVVVLLLGAGAIVTALRLTGKTIDIRVVDVVTASPTPALPPSATSTVVATSMAQPTPRPTEIPVTRLTPVPTETPSVAPVAVPTNTPVPSATPVQIGGTPGLSPVASPRGTPPTATPTLVPGTLVEYTIQTGDTLSAIALQFDTTVEAITARNQITDPSNILWGFKLQIVVGEKTPPTVQPSGSPQPGNRTTPAATPTA